MYRLNIRWRPRWPQPAIAAVTLVALALSASSVQANSDAASETTITLDADTVWVVSAAEPEPLRRALRDVETDWYKVLGRLPTVLDRPPDNWDRPVIYFGVRAPWLKGPHKAEYPGPESFALQAKTDDRGKVALLATGADVRGAIYAAYTLSEELLGVDPWYYWVDKEPEYKGHVEIAVDYHKTWGPPTFKYRGWFINDEDLLARFSHDPWGENIVSLSMTDRIYETLLRLRGNTIIPGTFTFPDEQHQVLASKRGLINSQHHINVVGLNTFRWPKEVPYSYHSHPEILEQMWQKCVDALKDREVIWTVGYRGKHDRPFWADDSAIAAPKARGKLISRAIAKQVEMIRAAQPEADCICNLWMEGVELYQRGYVTLPEGVILVWPDDGGGIIRDEGRVKAGQGTYYHTAMLSGRHNQLTEMVPPGRIHQELGRFVRAEATTYFVVNVSDVRPVPLSTDYAMRMAWDASAEMDKSSPQAQNEFLLDWSGRQFGADAAGPVAAIYREYFSTPYMKLRDGDHRLFSNMTRLMASVAVEANRRTVPKRKTLDSAREYLKEREDSYRHLVALSERALALKSTIPPDRTDFYQGHVLTQISIHRRGSAVLRAICEAILAFGQKKKDSAIEHLDEALGEYEALLAPMRKAEYGRWRGWYAGERFVGVYEVHNGIKRFRACLASEPRPVARHRGRYAELYEYQEKFKQNFPLLYPAR